MIAVQKNLVFAEVSSSQLICDIRRSCGSQHRAPTMPCRFLAHRVISLPRGNSVAFGLKRTLGRPSQRAGKALVGAGSVKPFAITGKARLPSSPDIPTADEAGLPGFFASLWYGLWVPKDTPKEIVAKLNATLVQTLADPAVQKRFEELGIQITPLQPQSPEALRAFQKAETERWWPIIRAANLKGE
jgi:hypothetical protein